MQWLHTKAYTLGVLMEVAGLLLLAYLLQHLWLQAAWTEQRWEFGVWAELLIYTLPVSALMVWRGIRLAKQSMAERVGRRLRPLIVNCSAVFALGLALSAGLVQYQIESVKNTAQARFDHLVELLASDVKLRFDLPAKGLRGLAALFEARLQFHGDEFRRYVVARNVLKDFPGVRGFGLIERIERDELENFLLHESARAESFQLKTSGDAADLFIIKYIEPVENNLPALGFDIGAEPVRRAAAERALRSGQATLTPFLKSLGNSPGANSSSDFLFLLPLHHIGADLSTEQQRMAASAGLLYAPIKLKELLADIGHTTQGLLDFELFEGSSAMPGALLFDLDGDHAARKEANKPLDTARRGRMFQVAQTIFVGGQPLTLLLSSTKQFDTLVIEGKPFWAGVGGVALSMMSVMMVWLFGIGRARALFIADEMTSGFRQATAEAEAALREHQFLLDTLKHHSLVSSADAKGLFTYANDEYCLVSGYRRDELLGESFDLVGLQPESKAVLLEARAQIFRGRLWSGELGHVNKQGQPYWVKTTIAPFLDASGQVERFVAIHTDITRQKQAEAEMRVRSEQLAAIFALSPDGFVSFDAQHQVRYISPAFNTLTGLTSEAVLGLRDDALLRLLAQQGSEQAATASMAQLREASRLVALERPTHRVLELTLRQGQSAEIAQVLQLRDVSHQIEVDRMKSEFLHTAAHELRTPMASIYGFSELLISREMAPERQKQFLRKIYAQSQVMVAIINDLLDLARMETRGDKDLTLQRLDLAALLVQAVEQFEVPAGRAPVELDLGSSPCFVKVDAISLLHVMRNLLSNAFKYSPGGGAVQVRLLRPADAAATQIAIEVQDHGIGMTAEQLPHITERFYRADKSGTVLGAGLGMSIVKDILDLQGGELRITSEPGLGSTVSVLLPVSSAQVSKAQSTPQPG
ncbi:CHASE domain-containing protein [Paucibacter sp. B2R-40]|uniref:CHASE domain-containing protein n=1 Tax=Paucibacter sp. B2R-40 TaxID=2893554 RepID=UPI0021E4B65A|nr:CHASE domain-containing protein [Paucibacter sp. B2R-40]MCV2356219.1 CHASE domain-containing protein [Paucibacter sp. B2R-40]